MTDKAEQLTITQADVELWRAGNAAALDAAGYVIDAEQCRQGQFDDLEPAKEFQREIARQRRATLTAIEEMMDEFVTNWPKPKKMKTALALIAKVIRAAINPASHNYWGAGEAECPSDIKAGNGELHTLRCKVCGRDNPEDNRCFEGFTPSLAAQDGLVEAFYIDCEFDGHNGPLLSIALVGDADSIHIKTTAPVQDDWVRENVLPLMGMHNAPKSASVSLNDVGGVIRAFLGDCKCPIIIADSPVDIGRFCRALSTGADGQWASADFPAMRFDVHNVDCYPTALEGAVQHNAWWDAMALKAALSAIKGDKS